MTKTVLTVCAHVLIEASYAGNCSVEEISLWKGTREFGDSIVRLAKRGLGKGSYVSYQLVQEYQPTLTRPCADCHGRFVTCISTVCCGNCLVPPFSAECLTCFNSKCGNDYMACVGVPVVEDLPIRTTLARDLESSSDQVTRLLSEMETSSTGEPSESITSTLPTLLPLDIELWEIEDPVSENEEGEDE
jgi:hypothetical protein